MRRKLILVSGGQTGVDRATLRFAVEHGWTYRGWTPAGGQAEDLPNPPGVIGLYPLLRETESRDPKHRTSLNVEEADATLVVTTGAASPGLDWALECVATFGKPCLTVSPEDPVEPVRRWLERVEDLASLNLAGPRESEAPGIEAQTKAFLERLLLS